MRKKRGTRGAVSVFLAIILVPCIVVSSLFVDVSRVQLSKAMTESSADLAMNALLTNYDADLKEWYGMIASCQNIQQFYEASANFFIRTLKSQGLSDSEVALLSDYYSYVTGDDTIHDLLAVEPQSAASGMIKEVTGANLSNAKLIKDQVVEFMKYRAPIEIATNLIERFKDPTTLAAFEANANEDLVENKQEFYESEGALIEAAYESYKAINKYWNAAKNGKLTNDVLSGIYTKLEGYKTAYKDVLNYSVIYESGTGDLTTQYTRPNRTITYYNDLYSNPSRNFSEVYSQKKKVDGVETYYIDLADAKKLVDDLSSKIEAFNTAKTNYANAASSALQDLPVNNTESGKTNTTRWWLKMYNAIYKSGTNHHNKVQTAGENMLRAYSRVLAIDKCELRGTVPKGWSSLDDWYEKYGVEDLVKKAENTQARYLKTGVSDDSDSYLKAVRNFESASSSSKSAKSSYRVTVDGKKYTPEGALKEISTSLTNIRKQMKEISDLLNVAINGKGDTPALSDLSEYANNYNTTLKAWDKSSKNTYHKGQLTGLAKDDQTEITTKKSENLIVEIKKSDVTKLETRLTNIKKQLDAVISAIDSLKWGGKAIKDITTLSTFKSKAGIRTADIGMKNSAISTYVTNQFNAKFAPKTMPKFQHANDSSYNPTINPTTKEVDTPYLWYYLYDKYQGKEDAIDDAKKEQGDAENEGTAKENEAKNKGRYNYKGKNVKWEYSGAAVFGLDELFNSLLNFAEKIAEGESALVSARDDLYVTTYIMEMFSHAAYEREGEYKLLDAEKRKTLTLNNFSKTYETVSGTNAENAKGTWASSDPVDHYNKTLTNKQITTANNAAYCAEIEYILCGGNGKTNAENVKAVFGKIYTIRYGINLISAFANFWSGTNNTAKAIDGAAMAVSAATTGLVPAALVKVVILPILAIFETSSDMDRLEAGFPVELYKTDAKMWWWSLETNNKPKKISEFMTALKSINPKEKVNTDTGLFYSDYLTIFVYLGISGDSGNAMLQRMAEVIQFNIATMSKKSDYSLKKSRMYFTLTSDVRVKPLMIDLPIFTNNDYAGSLRENFDWCSYKVTVTRGYT